MQGRESLQVLPETSNFVSVCSGFFRAFSPNLWSFFQIHGRLCIFSDISCQNFCELFVMPCRPHEWLARYRQEPTKTDKDFRYYFKQTPVRIVWERLNLVGFRRNISELPLKNRQRTCKKLDVRDSNFSGNIAYKRIRSTQRIHPFLTYDIRVLLCLLQHLPADS